MAMEAARQKLRAFCGNADLKACISSRLSSSNVAKCGYIDIAEL